jgi:hypothetical protein
MRGCGHANALKAVFARTFTTRSMSRLSQTSELVSMSDFEGASFELLLQVYVEL